MSVVGWDGRGARAYDLCVCVYERERESVAVEGRQSVLYRALPSFDVVISPLHKHPPSSPLHACFA